MQWLLLIIYVIDYRSVFRSGDMTPPYGHLKCAACLAKFAAERLLKRYMFFRHRTKNTGSNPAVVNVWFTPQTLLTSTSFRALQPKWIHLRPTTHSEIRQTWTSTASISLANGAATDRLHFTEDFRTQSNLTTTSTTVHLAPSSNTCRDAGSQEGSFPFRRRCQEDVASSRLNDVQVRLIIILTLIIAPKSIQLSLKYTNNSN